MKRSFFVGLIAAFTISTTAWAESWLAEYATMNSSGEIAMVSGTTTVFSNQQECVNMNNNKCYHVDACGYTVWLTGYQDSTLAQHVQQSPNNAVGFRKDLYSERFCVMSAK